MKRFRGFPFVPLMIVVLFVVIGASIVFDSMTRRWREPFCFGSGSGTVVWDPEGVSYRLQYYFDGENGPFEVIQRKVGTADWEILDELSPEGGQLIQEGRQIRDQGRDKRCPSLGGK